MMHRCTLISTLLAVLGFLLSPQLFAATLINGQRLSGSISVPGQVDQHTFSANAGDSIYLRAADTGPASFTPEISLFDPDGDFVSSNSGSLVAHLDGLSLVKSGTYTVLIGDNASGADNTGPYDLYYVKAPGANDNGVLPNGGVLPGEIDLGDLDTYTFDASAGEVVYLRVADTESTSFINSSFAPNVALFDPDGDLVTSNTGSLVAHLDGVSLVESGTYTVVVRDDSSGDDNIGSYNIYYAKAPGANDDGVLPNGGVLPGEIDLGDLDTYAFDASAGEVVYLRVADTESTEFIPSSFSPNIALFDPDGDLVTSNTGSLVAHLDGVSLVESGTYTVVVRDDSSGDDNIGSYDIYYAKAPGANNDGVLPNGGVLPGEIDLGDLDTYAFDAAAGEVVFLRVADTESTEFISSSFAPNIALFDPDGDLVTSNTGSLVAHLDGVSLVESGTYTVVVRDDSSGDDNIGSYNIYYAKAPGANDDGCLPNGASVAGFIGLGDLDSYSFDATAGTTVLVTMTDLDNTDFRPFIALFGPTGALLTSNGNSTVAQINLTVSASGTYTLIARDDSSGDDAAGNYSIDVNGVGITCPALQCNGLAVTVNLANGDSPTIGDDVILGTSGSDTINALSGNDTICALSGDDIINAGGGNDWVEGGSGHDNIFGGGGDDSLYAGPGDDIVIGSSGDDDIEGDAGDDTLFGQVGDDTIDGGSGVDSISGGPGADTIFTGSGATVGSGVFVTGGGGGDFIFGGSDADSLKGGGGADTIRGGDGNDVITGGVGRDTIDGEGGNDDIRGQGSRDTLNGGTGSDTITGGAQDDIINGGSGSDMLTGGSGDDEINGEAGSDTILGGSGDDNMDGGPSVGDSCDGQSGLDTASGTCESVAGVP